MKLITQSRVFKQNSISLSNNVNTNCIGNIVDIIQTEVVFLMKDK